MTPRRIRSSAARLPGLVIVIAVALAAAVTTFAGAEDSSEATTYGADGIATQILGEHLDAASVTGISVRIDEGLTVEGDTDVKSFSPNGRPEPDAAPSARPEGQTFPAEGGKSLVLAADGKVTRLDADGAVDPDFGKEGTIEAPGAASVAVAELASGQILAFHSEYGGGRIPTNTGYVELLDPHGGAATGATVIPNLPAGGAATVVREMLRTPDGGFLIVDSGYLLKLRADGSPDPAFGSKGVAAGGLEIAGAHFLSDGSIEVLGQRYLRGREGSVPAVERLTAAGQPEAAFGDTGMRILTRVDVWWNLDVVSWGTDGSAIAGGGQYAAGCQGKLCEEAPVLVAVDPEGNLETEFGDGGVLRLQALAGAAGEDGGLGNGVSALARRSDGSIVAAGKAPPDEATAFIVSLGRDGALVPSFGEAGIVRFGHTVPATERLSAFAPLPGGQLLATGWTDVGLAQGAILARYDADGSLDSSFGDGKGWVSLPGHGRESELLAVRGSRALLAPYGYPRGHLLMVHVADGSPVASFGADGLVHLPQRESAAGALVFASDGDPVVLEGPGSPDPEEHFVLRRYRPDGRPDRKFGGDGKATLQLPGSLDDGAMIAVGGGRLLVAGIQGDRLVVGRLLPDGRLDRRFGTDGWSLTRVHGSVKAMSMAGDGSRILLAATVGRAGHRKVVLVRLLADGRPDEGFGDRGIRSAATGSGYPPTAILPTADGATVLLERGPRPVITFAPGGAVYRRSVGGPEPAVWQVHGTASGGRLVVGWAPLRENSNYSISSLPLRP